MADVRILGPFPPPFGGVAIHCVRLIEGLRSRGVIATGFSLGGIPHGVAGIRKLSPLFFLSRTLVHYHTDEGNHRWMRLFSIIWRLTRTPYVVTVHSFRDRPEFHNPRILRELSLAFKNAKALISISDETSRDLEDRLNFRHSHARVIPSALPLSTWERVAPLQQSIAKEWQNSPIRILANAGRIVSYNGQDLYGLDILIDALAGIPDADVALCLAVGEIVDDGLWKSLTVKIDLDHRISIVRDLDLPLAPLVQQAQIVVRPTRTEGGPSLTLTEAQELGKWAIGSNSVQRPNGIMLFRNGDSKDLMDVLNVCIDNVRNLRIPQKVEISSDTVDRIMNVYRRFQR